MKFGFIGIGRIATSVIRGFCTSNIENITINISPRGESNSVGLEEAFSNVTRMVSNQAVVNNSEIIFLALPPKGARETLKELKFNNNQIVVSFIPFLEYKELLKITAQVAHVARAIPFPTVEKHNCPILLFNDNPLILEIFNHLGHPIVVEKESDLHTLWALTGLIAPFYDLCENISYWAQSKGIQADVANNYIMDMFNSLTSAAKNEPQLDFTGLKNEATTPNGMNEQALRMISENKVHATYQHAADAILDRFLTKE